MEGIRTSNENMPGMGQIQQNGNLESLPLQDDNDTMRNKSLTDTC